MEYQNKWVREITALQRDDGSWGYFHSLAAPTKKQPLTTEQALKRLQVLGLTLNDEPIRRAIRYIEKCAAGDLTIPDRVEVNPDWSFFLSTMFAAWLRILNVHNKTAATVARRWAEVIRIAFGGGSFDQSAYENAYRLVLRPQRKKVHYFKSIANFYLLSLLPDLLPIEVERRMIDYVMQYPGGILYIGYPRAVRELPPVFASLETSRYIAALELLAWYSVAPEKLAFAGDWLKSKQDKDGQWDLGSKANDGLYFPLSDSWRKTEIRKADCTRRIERLLAKIKASQ